MVAGTASATVELGPSLDKHEGLSAERCKPEELQRPEKCLRWPKHLALRSAAGRVVEGRCKGPNRCDYCAMQAGVLAREMMSLDALHGDAPSVLVVLTTRTETLDVSGFAGHRADWIRSIREGVGRRVEFATTVEYQERGAPHWNNLLKGVGPAELETVERATAEQWCRQADATMAGQYVGEISSAAAVTKYLASHFTKRRQWPPPGFKGQRFNCSKGYFGDLSRSEMRETAKLSLASKRALHRALAEGLVGASAEARAREIVADAAVEWELVERRAGGLRAVGTGDRVRVREMRPDRSVPSWVGTLFEAWRPDPERRRVGR